MTDFRKLTKLLPALPLLACLTFGKAEAAQSSCVMPNTGTVSGLTLVNDITACAGSLLSLYSGATAPASPTTYMLWEDTSGALPVLRQYDGANWNIIFTLDPTNHFAIMPIGGGGIGAITAASTTDVGAVPQAAVKINGTTTITSFGTSSILGSIHVLTFTNTLTITRNATSLIVPGTNNITTQAGDVAIAMYLGSGNWQIVSYNPASGAAVSNPALPVGSLIYGTFGTPPAKTVSAFGQALSRASFPNFLAAVTRAQNGTLTSGNATIASVANTAGFGVGMPVEGSGISTGCTISSIVANTSITLNSGSCVTATGVNTVTVFLNGYGTGGDSTTVGVKDCRDMSLVGRGDMGGTDRALLSSTYFLANPLALNSFGGLQNHNLTLTEAPTGITSSSTQSITVQAPGAGSPNFITAIAGIQTLTTPNAGGATFTAGQASSGLASGFSSAIGTNTINVTSNNTNGNPHSIIPPSAIAECVQVVSP